jgi:hypothetical protein
LRFFIAFVRATGSSFFAIELFSALFVYKFVSMRVRKPARITGFVTKI